VRSIRFEWDEQKNRENLRKHKITFEQAKMVFAGPMTVRADARHDYGEERWVGIGRVGGRTVLVVFKVPGLDLVRLISARKALKWERKEYEEAIANELGRV
jgi:uncharacterized DUF497 family protein